MENPIVKPLQLQLPTVPRDEYEEGREKKLITIISVWVAPAPSYLDR